MAQKADTSEKMLKRCNFQMFPLQLCCLHAYTTNWCRIVLHWKSDLFQFSEHRVHNSYNSVCCILFWRNQQPNFQSNQPSRLCRLMDYDYISFSHLCGAHFCRINDRGYGFKHPLSSLWFMSTAPAATLVRRQQRHIHVIYYIPPLYASACSLVCAPMCATI